MASSGVVLCARRARRSVRKLLIFASGVAVFTVALYGTSTIGANEAAVDTQGRHEVNPRADYWRSVRHGNAGYTAVSGAYTVSDLIQSGGQSWRAIRNGPVAAYGAGALLFVIVLLAGVYAFRGPVRIKNGRSNMTIPRWSVFERVVHWYVATLFVVLALTGLSLLFGRAALIPVLGNKAFAYWAKLAMVTHNFIGPAFVLGVLVMIVMWFKNNIPARYDWSFFKQGMGMVKGKHPHAGKANAGEKLFVYWLGLMGAGLVCSATGLILDFPNYGQTRETMQLAHVLHSIAALIWTFLMLGHAYLGSVGVEGSLEGMTSGRVDVKFAKQHNDIWADELMRAGVTPVPRYAADEEGL